MYNSVITYVLDVAMKDKPLLRAQISLICTVLIAAVCVYLIVYGMTHSTMLGDMRDRSHGIRNYIEKTIFTDSFFRDIAQGGDRRVAAAISAQNRLSEIKGAAGVRHLFFAWINDGGNIATSLYLPDSLGSVAAYIPPSELYKHLSESFITGAATSTGRIYHTESGATYAVYWPVLAADGSAAFAVAMEFDADSVHRSFRTMTIYSIALSIVLVAIISTVANISLSKVNEPFYKKLAYIDFLTDCENRLAFEHRMRYCEGRIAKLGMDVTILVFDVNSLKVVNDTYGHKIGDQYLVATADIIKQHLAGIGPLFRIGGDEFASIILGKNEKEMEEVIKKLQDEQSITIKDRPFSCPVGAATYQKDIDENLRGTFARADENMYKEKMSRKERANANGAS